MARYIALIHKDPETDYSVQFPDFPGAVTVGGTLDEAIEHAREALALHIEAMADDGEAIPAPSSLEAVTRSRAARGAVAVYIEAPVPRGRAVRVNVTIDEHVLRRVDRIEDNRSAFIDHALRAELARRGA